MGDTVSRVDLDEVLASVFLTAEGKADPYPGFATVREAVQIHDSALGVKIATRYDDVNTILRDNRFGHGAQRLDASRFGVTQEEFDERFPDQGGMNESMLELDPPDHTRLRGLVAKAFTPKTVEQLKPEITRLADALLEPLEGEVDLMPALALKLPITVIGRMLGVPESDHAEEEGDTLSERELIATVILLFVAGYETTTNLIGNGTRALLLHPDQLQRVRADRALVRPAIEEILRWDSPVQLTSRRCLVEEAEVNGQRFVEGEEVITILAAANRDPRAYDRPDQFEVQRTGPTPLSFSAGIHHCLGAALARAEGQIVFDSLLDRYSTIAPAWSDDEPLRYRDNLVLRGLEALPVQLLV